MGEGEGGMIWENSIEPCVWNICEMDDQSKFSAWNRALKAGALGQPRWMEWGGEWEVVWNGGHMYTCAWFMAKTTTIL